MDLTLSVTICDEYIHLYSDNKEIIVIETHLNQTLNKMKSCMNQALNNIPI